MPACCASQLRALLQFMDASEAPSSLQARGILPHRAHRSPPPSARIQPGNVNLFRPAYPSSSQQRSDDDLQALHDDEFITAASKDESHSWAPCAPHTFRLRSGPNYRSTGKKMPSMYSLYEVYAIDVFSSEQKIPHIGRVASLPEDSDAAALEGLLPPYLVVNWMFPNYPPSGMLGPRRTNGPGVNLVLYCRLSERVRAMVRQGSHAQLPGVDLLRRFMHPTGGASLRGQRLKCIFGLADKEQSSAFGMVLKQLINRWNFKPFISKTASWCYVGQDYFEIDVDMHLWGNAALSALNTVKDKAHNVLLRGGVVVEAVEDAEMPEQLLVGAYLIRIDHREKAASMPPEAVAYLTDPANHVEPLARYDKDRGGESSGCMTPGASPPTLSPPTLSPREGEEAFALCSMSDSTDRDPDTAR